MVTPPGPLSAELSDDIRQGIIEHARAGYPNEACGLIIGSATAADGGRALRFLPTRNAAASPSRYEIDSGELLAATLEAEAIDGEIWAIVHSHLHTAARPSPTDIGLAFYPDPLYILVSLSPAEADPTSGQPGIRAWRIVGGEVFEVALEVEPEVKSEG